MVSCDNGNSGGQEEARASVATRNLDRAMEITDAAIEHYFDEGAGMAMTEFYNPFTGAKSSGTVDVWPYTSAIEAVNAIMHALIAQKEAGDATLYDQNFSRYTELMESLYKGLQYYEGSFELVSYTQPLRGWRARPSTA